MGMIKKLPKCLLITLLILIFTLPLWIKVVPTKYISLLTGKSTTIDSVICNFSTRVSGESMSPLITPGSLMQMDRCFKTNDLSEGVVVLFKNDSNLRFGIIRHILPLDPIVYKVSDEKAPERLHDVIKEEIAGITKNIDVSKSRYQAQQGVESFIIDADKFLTDFYLGRIPRGFGVEMAKVEKTNIFFIEKDKFCAVVFPKKELVFVDIEIVDAKTGKIVRSSKNIVFNVRPEPNIGCEDFGSDQGMLNIGPGTYRYRFLMNHQALKDVPFEVR